MVVAVVVHRQAGGSVDDYGDDHGGRWSTLGPPSLWNAGRKDRGIANNILERDFVFHASRHTKRFKVAAGTVR